MPRRLIEEAFPLQKVSEDSIHEQEVNHGRPNGLHYWPARRPLAACRAVTITTLLPDPADAPEKVKAEYTRLSRSPLPDKQREYLCDLIASLTRWGTENGHGDWNEKDQKGRWLNKLRIIRELIEMAYNGQPPKVMDMFAGGGAIPLEAMRLGCEVYGHCTQCRGTRTAGPAYDRDSVRCAAIPPARATMGAGMRVHTLDGGRCLA